MYSILIVDDEENVIRLLKKVFVKEGYNVYTASNGCEALQVIDIHQIDLVISDIKMAGMDGIDLLGHIKKLDSNIRVVLITAFATLETAINALKMGASDYFTKPFNLDELAASVKNLLKDNSSGMHTYVDSKQKLTTKSPAMQKVLDIIRQVSDSRVTVMLYGETGTGKELAAHTIHDMSIRKDKPFVKVNCAAIPDALLESELFGYEKGAFTGAVARKPGRFELADEGTIFLDEIGDIAPATQVKLLRVLQEREFERLGGIKTIKTDVRIIAATNKNLVELVKEGSFREDLYYRLNVVPITLPPLRERKEDIEIMIDYFLDKSSSISGKQKKKITEAAFQKLKNYNWPGNIRELENTIERSVVVTPGNIIDINDLPDFILKYGGESPLKSSIGTSLDEAVDDKEKEIIINTLRECGGNRTRASEKLGISRRSLHRKLIKYDIEE